MTDQASRLLAMACATSGITSTGRALVIRRADTGAWEARPGVRVPHQE
jgi:hypothetical protein